MKKSDVYGCQKYSDGYADYPGKGKIYDKDVAKLVSKHLRFFDRFNVRKVVEAGIYAQLMLMGVVEEPKKKNWKF